MRRWFWLGLALALTVIWTTSALAGYLTPGLQAKVEKAAPGEMLKVIVYMNGETDISVLPPEQKDAMVKQLQDFAANSQRDLLATLPKYGDKVAKVTPLWITNVIGMEATPEVIRDLVMRLDVARIDEDRIIQLEDTHPRDIPRINAKEWGIIKIKADSVWLMLGYNGTGIVVGNMDTGVLTTHVTFGGRYRGGNNSWLDAVNNQTTPYDDHGHGTHTMGTICGGSTADTIGVARGATFVAAKAFNSGGSGSTVDIMECYQWFAGTSRPHIFGNSWGNSNGADTSFWTASRNCQILGIHQAYSNGNSGPGSGSVGAPASMPFNIGVGATDVSDVIAGFSSRGPSPAFPAGRESTAQYLDPNWAASRRKPDLSAPGVAVRSSYNNGGYTSMDGTSMASPHVTGVIALMLQKNDLIRDTTIWRVLTQSVDTPAAGRPYPNQNYGWGRLNAYRAVQLTPAKYAQFALGAQAADTVAPNTVTVDSVTVSSMGSFISPVTMTLDSIRPAEPTITIAFAPNPVTPPPNGSVKTGMRITTTSGTPQQNYMLYYKGVGDTVTRRATMALWVTAPTFVIQSTPRTQTIFLGDSTNYADTVVSISGYNSPCTLSATVSPPAPSITVSFLPNNVVIPTDGRWMRVKTTGQTTPGTYVITAQARNGGTVRTVADTLIVRYPVQGPDPYGYYAYDNTDAIFENSPTYAWIELNPSRGGNGTTVGISGDDMSLRKLFGIRARHYGFHGDSASICTNGWLAVGRTLLQVYSNAALPSASFVPGGVAGIWDDLTISGTGTCWYRVDANQRFIAEWDSVPTLGGSFAGTFEIIVMDTSLTPSTANTRDSEILLQWKSVGTIASATVGQQNQAMSVGLNCFNNGTYDPMMAPITAGRATKFTTDPPRLKNAVELGPVFSNLPMRFALGPAVPNPSKGNVGISYDLPVETQVSLKVYNLSGQLVRTLVSGKEKAGYKHLSWDGRSENGTRTASGVYFYRLEAGSFTATKKLVVVR